MVCISCETWSLYFSWSVRKLAPAKWAFPFEVEDSLWSPESSMVGNGGHHNNGGCWPPFPTMELSGDPGPSCWPLFWIVELSGDPGPLKTPEMRCGQEDDTGDDWIGASIGSVSCLNWGFCTYKMSDAGISTFQFQVVGNSQDQLFFSNVAILAWTQMTAAVLMRFQLQPTEKTAFSFSDLTNWRQWQWLQFTTLGIHISLPSCHIHMKNNMEVDSSVLCIYHFHWMELCILGGKHGIVLQCPAFTFWYAMYLLGIYV